MHSQVNLYAILDVLDVEAEVGLNKILINQDKEIYTERMPFKLTIENAMENSIHETEDSMYVIVKSCDLVMLFKAFHGQIMRTILFNIKDVSLYINSNDFPALLTALNEGHLKILEELKC